MMNVIPHETETFMISKNKMDHIKPHQNKRFLYILRNKLKTNFLYKTTVSQGL